MADTFLTVPFSNWHPDRKQWYLPDGVDPAPFTRWAEIRMDENK